MITTLVTWPYGTIVETKDRVLIMGFQEGVGGEIRTIVADLESGEVSVVGLKDVVVDPDKLRRLPL